MAAAFSESSGKVRSGNRLLTMALAGLIGGGVGYLLSQIPGEPTTESGLKSYSGLTFMLMIIAIGAALIVGNAILDGHPPSGEIIAMAAAALAVLGFLSGYIAQALYSSMIDAEEINACFDYECVANAIRPARTVGWGLAGALGGVGIGLAFRSKKRLQNAIIGGAVGGLIGGFLFDLIPQILDTDSPTAPRLVAVCIIGVLIGVLIAAIDAARTDMFLEVISGEMRGRQFLIMDATTRVGSARSAGVVLLADREVAEVHLTIERSPNGATFVCTTSQPVLLNGATAMNGSLSNGDVLQVGRTEVRVGFKKATGAPSMSAGPSPVTAQPSPRPTATQASAGHVAPPSAGVPPRAPAPAPQAPSPATPSPPPAARPRLPVKPPQ